MNISVDLDIIVPKSFRVCLVVWRAGAIEGDLDGGAAGESIESNSANKESNSLNFVVIRAISRLISNIAFGICSRAGRSMQKRRIGVPKVPRK